MGTVVGKAGGGTRVVASGFILCGTSGPNGEQKRLEIGQARDDEDGCKDCGQESAYRARGSDRRLGLRGSGCETHAKSQPQLGGSTTVARRVPTTRRLPATATATDAGLLSNRATHLGSFGYSYFPWARRPQALLIVLKRASRSTDKKKRSFLAVGAMTLP